MECHPGHENHRKLHVKLIRAAGLKSRWFKPPYNTCASLEILGTTEKKLSKTLERGGPFPEWHTNFEFSVPEHILLRQLPVLMLQIFDPEISKFLGVACISLSRAVFAPTIVQKTKIRLCLSDGRRKGRVEIEFKMMGDPFTPTQLLGVKELHQEALKGSAILKSTTVKSMMTPQPNASKSRGPMMDTGGNTGPQGSVGAMNDVVLAAATSAMICSLAISDVGGDFGGGDGGACGGGCGGGCGGCGG